MQEMKKSKINSRSRSFPDLTGKYSIQLQTTTACNAACVICPHRHTWGKVPVQYMPDSVIDKVIENMKNKSIYRISPYLQNEPLCDARIFDILKKIDAELSFDNICFSANAMSLNKNNSENLAEVFSKIKHEIRISFHGVDKKTYEHNMQLDFEKSLEHLKNFLNIAMEAQLNIIIKGLGINQKFIGAVAQEFSENNFLNFWFDFCKKNEINMENIEFRYSPYHDRSKNIFDENQFNFNTGMRKTLSGFGCTRVDKWFHVSYDGSLIICCNDYHREIILGDLTKDNIDFIMKSNKYRMIVGMVYGEIESPSDFICKRCFSPGG